MLLHKLARHEQTKPRTVCFGREIRLKQLRQMLRRDPAAIVAHAHFNAAGLGGHIQFNAAIAVGHVDRIEDEIEKDLHELIAYRQQRRQIWRHCRRRNSAPRALVILGNVEGLVENVRQRNATAFVAGRPAELDQFAQDGTDALQLAADQAVVPGCEEASQLRRWSSCTMELIDVSGLPTSWAIPAASKPNAAIFS